MQCNVVCLLKLSYAIDSDVVLLSKVMTHLAEYVARIYDLQSKHETCNTQLKIAHVTEQARQSDLDDVTFMQTTKIYTFVDGTQLKQTIEQDNQLFEVEACLESWIEYQVIHHSNEKIHPQKIHFDNHCRELHWIKCFNSAQN
ncbi:MAG: hypothetical protein GAK29_00552 [Acinetobacter bereziniae]|uniref:Uncharacterized protein n=1 Tax=Acinetobacter bereziniae TaxID=106648 RepID=A0A833PIR2_ACIBZ|nr:MAG: hypothetical protein GAK29_00552 [Acinetobacter bereziniae]